MSQDRPTEPESFPSRGVRLGLWTLLGVFAIGRVIAVFTENVNWDELALLARAEALVRTGVIQGGGRPGLVTAALAPIASACTNAIQGVVAARHFWTLMTLASAGAFWALMHTALPASRTRWLAATTALGIWVLSPDFLRYSVQVRTDQPAILLVLVGGLVLLRSRVSLGWAPLAGVLFGLGFLATQKALYVMALVGVVAGAWHLLRSDWVWRRELTRMGLSGVLFLGVIAGYRTLAQAAGQERVTLVSVPTMQRVFEYYRETIGFRYYLEMMDRNVVHVLVPGLLLFATLLWIRRRGPAWRYLVAGWGVVAWGAVVFGFHAGRFPYFYLVLGLFPAAAAGFLMGPLFTTMSTPRRGVLVALSLWAMLVVTGSSFLATMVLHDDQAQQRHSLRWIGETFASDARGFGSLSELVCRGDPDPFPNRFYENVLFTFVEADGEPEVQRIMNEFRARPVLFMFEPRSHYPYPEHLWDFWRTRYVPYAGNVSIPGRGVHGSAGTRTTFEVIVPGAYRWWPAEGGDGLLIVGGDTVRAGHPIELGRGIVQLELPQDGGGIFAWAVAEPPAPSEMPFFRPF